MGDPSRPAIRFWSKVDKSGDCWIYNGERLASGYGKLKIGVQYWLAHRFSYHLAHRGIPEGVFVCHSCDNPPCVRPDHLFAGTARDNMRDMVTKLRSRSPITLEQLMSIYELGKAGSKPTEIGRELEISSSTVRNVLIGRTFTPFFEQAHPEMYDLDFGGS